MLFLKATSLAHAQTDNGTNIFDFGKGNNPAAANTQTASSAPAEKAGARPSATQPVPVLKPVVKSKIPDAAAQRAASKRVNDVFGAQVVAAKQPADKLKLAQKLLQAGTDEQIDLDCRFVLLTLAADEASSAGNFDIALQSIDELAKSHQIDSVKLTSDAAVATAKVIRSPQDRIQLVGAIIGLIEQAVAEDRYELAVQLGNQAVTTARLAEDTNSIRQSAAELARVREIQSAYVEIKPSIEMLAHNPTDPEANLKVGKFRCLIKGDWRHGLPLLALGGPTDLPKLAGKELAAPSVAKDQIAIGDGWWDQADKLPAHQKLLAQQHATMWYRQALPSVDKGLAREKLQQRIQSCSDGADAVPVAVVAAKSTELFDWKVENLSKYEHLKVVTAWERTPPKTTLAGQVVKGALNLTQQNSPYLITGPLVVPSGSTLTIEPGAVVLFAAKIKLQVDGTLTAVSDGPWIVLAAVDATTGWSGIASSGKIDLRRCLVSGADDVLEADAGKVEVACCIFANNENTLGFGNNGHGKVQDSLFLRNARGPLGHGDGGTVDFTKCSFLFNKVGCTANFYGKTKGDSSTFYGNDVAIEGSDRGDFVRMTLCNIITTSGKPLATRGGKAVVSGNYWGALVPADPAHDVSGPLPAPVKDAFPNLPACEYLSMTTGEAIPAAQVKPVAPQRLVKNSAAGRWIEPLAKVEYILNADGTATTAYNGGTNTGTFVVNADGNAITVKWDKGGWTDTYKLEGGNWYKYTVHDGVKQGTRIEILPPR